MQLTRHLLARVPKAPFPKSGKHFDSLFVTPDRPKKAWHGQDKDAFFRDKYSHVHAKQIQRRKAEQAASEARHNLKKLSSSNRPAEHAPSPARDFAARHQALLEKDRSLEFIYGTNAVRAVLEKRKVDKLLSGYSTPADMDRSIVKLAKELEVPIESNVPLQHLNIMTRNGVHNKVVAQTHKRLYPIISTWRTEGDEILINERYKLERVTAGRKLPVPFGIYLDEVTDTHNMGAIIRSACWFGADFVALSSRNSAPMSPAVVKASSGAAEFTQILEVPQPLWFFDQLKLENWAIVATTPAGADSHGLEAIRPELLREKLTELGRPVLLVVGSEGEGIRSSLLQRSTHRTSLASGQSDIDSLNVSVAAALLLSAIA